MMRSTRYVIAVLFSSLLAAWPATRACAADDVMYVTDQFEITMRSGTSTANSIIRMLRSGEPVTARRRARVGHPGVWRPGAERQLPECAGPCL